MKKKYYIFYLLIIFQLLIGCTINDSTGLITISNHTDRSSATVYLNSIILAYLGTGAKSDYWYYNDLSGNISIFIADNILAADHYDTEYGEIFYKEVQSCHFKTGYRYEIRITKITVDLGYDSDSLIVAYVEPGIKAGGNKSQSNFYHYPAD